jgi:hypothetical protein
MATSIASEVVLAFPAIAAVSGAGMEGTAAMVNHDEDFIFVEV